MFKFYKSEYCPSDLTGQVGGNITQYELSGYLGETFAYTVAPPEEYSGAYYQYRKVFVKNTYSSTSTNTRLWLDAEQHPGQIAIAIATGQLSNSITGSSNAPQGVSSWASPQNYSQGILVGTMTSNSSTGVWLRQKLQNITEPDPYSSLRIYVGGILN